MVGGGGLLNETTKPVGVKWVARAFEVYPFKTVNSVSIMYVTRICRTCLDAIFFWKNQWPNKFAILITTLGISIPSFAIATFLQYFVGLTTFQTKSPIALSQFVEIRRRMGDDVFEQFNQSIINKLESGNRSKTNKKLIDRNIINSFKTANQT